MRVSLEGGSLRRRFSNSANDWGGEAKALAWLLGGTGLSRFGGQLAVVLTARLLGPSEYGTLAAALAALSLVMVLADLGVGDAAVQHFTRREHGAASFWREVAPMRLVLSLPLLPAGLLMATLSSNDSIRACGLLFAVVPFSSLLSSRILGARISEAFSAAAGWTTVLGLCQSVGALVAVLLFARTGLTAASGVAISLVAASLLAVRGAGKQVRRGSLHGTWVRAGGPFVITATAVAIYSRADRIIVASIEGTEAAGQYAAAYNVVMIAALAGAALHAAVLPRLLHEHRSGLGPNWHRRAAVIVCVTLPPAAALLFMRARVMTTLYGSTFASTAPVLGILSILIVLYVLNPLLASFLVAAGRQRLLARISVVSAVLALVTYPVLTLEFGIVGTASASVITELLNTAFVIRALKRGMIQRVYCID